MEIDQTLLGERSDKMSRYGEYFGKDDGMEICVTALRGYRNVATCMCVSLVVQLDRETRFSLFVLSFHLPCECSQTSEARERLT